MIIKAIKTEYKFSSNMETCVDPNGSPTNYDVVYLKDPVS